MDSVVCLDPDWIGCVAALEGDHGHAHGTRCSELTDYLGENPDGTP